MAIKVYTKTGDKGETSLFGGKRISKADLRVEAYGTVDELNSVIGVTIAQIAVGKKYNKKLKVELLQIQQDLFEIGTLLASPKPNKKNKGERIKILKKRTEEFENFIDEMTKEIPDFQCFILPGVGITGSNLHLCRTVARRAERRIVALSKKEHVDLEVIIYCNRLSDLFFTMARFVNHKEKRKEIIWY